jgi:chromosome segregation ATPase
MGEDTTEEFPKNSLDVILARFESMEGSLNSRMDSFESRLTALDEKVDRRLMETRPIWEKVLSRLDSVDTRLDSIDKRFDLLESRVGAVESQMSLLAKGFDRVETEVENLSLKFRAFQGDLLRMQTRDERLAERLEKLENPPAA